jgi:hypothetical protein
MEISLWKKPGKKKQTNKQTNKPWRLSGEDEAKELLQN